MKLAAEMFELMTELFAIGPEELKNYDESKTGSGFGYKGLGSTVAGTGGERDRTEFYKVCIISHSHFCFHSSSIPKTANPPPYSFPASFVILAIFHKTRYTPKFVMSYN